MTDTLTQPEALEIARNAAARRGAALRVSQPDVQAEDLELAAYEALERRCRTRECAPTVAHCACTDWLRSNGPVNKSGNVRPDRRWWESYDVALDGGDRIRDLLPSNAAQPIDQLAASEFLDRLRGALIPRRRLILDLLRFGYRPVDIAENLGVSESAISQQVRIIIKQGKELL